MQYKLIGDNEFPRLWSFGRADNFRVFESPFGNCQSFSIIMAKELKFVDDADMRQLLKDIVKLTQRKQMVIDLNKDKSDDVIKKLEPYALNIISTPYVSTNGSNMIMHIVQLSYEKLNPDE